jgi:UDP-glucose 4-epimerase
MTSRPRFDGERVLVTGASGFIGAHLCRVLQEQGAEIHATSRGRRPAQPGSPHWYEADVSDVESSRALLRSVRPDVIFHLAGRVTAAPALDLVLPTFHSLVGGTVNLLVAATEIGCRRFILPGSLNEPASDAGEAMPSSPYAAAKWAASTYGRMFHGVFGAPIVVARLFMTYGPGQHASKLVPYVTRCLLRGEPPLVASGRWRADWIYIDDAVDGLLALARVPNLEGRTVDLGSGHLITVRAVVERVADLVGSRITPVFGGRTERPGEPVRRADAAATRARLGWTPQITLEQGLASTVAWYRHHLNDATTAGEVAS